MYILLQFDAEDARRLIREGALDLMVAIDVSRSMLTEDVKPNRLEKAKAEVESLISRLRGDRIGLIAFAVLAYVLFDGFDLGVGILFPALQGEEERDQAMNSVAPVWDGNETWLVLGGGGLFAAFPLAYSILMPALYTPMIAMLLGLVLRGVAFEFRWRTTRERNLWDIAFAGGSLVAASAQGIALGAILQGVTVANRQYAGGWWDWLTPFSVLTGFALVVRRRVPSTTSRLAAPPWLKVMPKSPVTSS